MIHSALVDRQTDTQTQKQTDTLPVVGIDDDDLLAGCSCVGNDDPLGFSRQTDRHTDTETDRHFTCGGYR